MIEAYHTTIAAAGRRRLAADDHGVRPVTAAVLRAAGAALVIFHITIDHLHLVLGGTRERTGRVTAAVVRALQALLGVEFEPARVTPVGGTRHIRTTTRCGPDHASA